MGQDNIKNLYDALKGEYDLGSEEEFRESLKDPVKRGNLYEAVSLEFDLGSEDDFNKSLGYGGQPVPAQSGVEGESQTPQPATESPEQPETAWQPTEDDKRRMSAWTRGISEAAKSTVKGSNERLDNLREYGKNMGDGHTVHGGYRLNMATGEMERTYLTPAGYRTADKAAADAISREYRDAVDMSVGGQIRRAQNRLQELTAKLSERAKELAEENRKMFEGNGGAFAALSRAKALESTHNSDQTLRALELAIRQTEKQIETLNEQRDRENGIDVGFWRGFYKVVKDPTTWNLGMTDIRDAATMLRADNPEGEQAEQEQAANREMMRAMYENQQAEVAYGGNASFWNRAGVMTGEMLPFMLDFALTGGGVNGLNIAGKWAGKASTKLIGKETLEQMAKQGFKTYVSNNGVKGFGLEAANWTIKALGATADDLLIRAPLMTNTVQAGKTAADIVDRKLGDVVVDENGNYDFSNDKTWGSAIWQGEGNTIIENFSEMFGGHLDPVLSLKNMGKLANWMGAKRLGGVLEKADAGALGGIMDQTQQLFNKMGVSGYVVEVSEEYYGQLWRTMLNLEDAYQQNADGTRTNLLFTGQFHGDIWGGMALSMGLLGAGKASISTANYLSLKHGVNKADARASELLTPDIWEPLRTTIDMATNDNVGDVAEVIVNDKELTDEEKAAVLDYMERSLYLRGANLAELAKSRGREPDENVQRANESYMHGYNAQGNEEMQDIRNMYELQRQKAGQVLTPEELAAVDNNPVEALQNTGWDEAVKQTVIDYINAKLVYDGMIQRVRDDIDGRIAQSDAMVDSRVNRSTGMIQGATLKVQDEDGNDRRVYVLDGNLVMLDDGTGIDRGKSDGSIVIRDAVTGKIEMVSPEAILSVEQPIDPEQEKQTAAEAIRQQFAQEAANRIDGVVSFALGDTYTIMDENGQPSQVQVVANEDGIVDNGDGTVNVSPDGGQTVVAMRKEDIQAMVDAANRARVEQAEQQREGMLPQAQPGGQQQDYRLNDEVTLLDEDGNEVRGDIVADANEDGQYEVVTDAPINGRRVNLFTREELDRLRADRPDDGQYERKNVSGGSSDIGPEPVGMQNGTAPLQDTLSNGKDSGNTANGQGNNVDDEYNAMIDRARDGDETARARLREYGLDWGRHGVYRFAAKGEVDNILAGGQYNGRFDDGRVDATNSDTPTTASAAEYRITFKDGFDFNKKGTPEADRAVMKNAELGDGYVTGGYTLDDVARIERRNDDGSYETVYDARQSATQEVQPQQSAMERIPKDEKGEPMYDQTDADTAWDAIVEQAEGDEEMAQNVADSMVADKEAELKKLEKAKPKGGTTIAEKIAAERERKNAVEQAKATLAAWQKIAQTAQRREAAIQAEQARQAAEAGRMRKEQEEKERMAREEAERIEREALNGVPDIIDDTPQDARARGYRRVNGGKADRQQPLPARQGKEVEVKFNDENIIAGHVALIDAGQLQPSHVNGQRNPYHFLDEAQPKERRDDASVMSARKIAANIRPEEITSSVTAYTGAPTVNMRGEVIQGNNRSAALREMWDGQPGQAQKYKQYLMEHAVDFGLTAEDVEAMQRPVLVNMVDVSDEDAITLGQFVAQDTESGGVERIKPKNLVQKMGNDMKGFARRLLASADEETTFAGLVDRNGTDVLKWMNQRGYITPTQYRSAFDSKGNLTAEAVNDLKGIMYQSIFQNGNTYLEEMFNALPAKAQKAILATAYRDYDSPNAERMSEELQSSIQAYYALSQYEPFRNAKNYKEARLAAEAWKMQSSFDDVTGESYLPSERYSNFAVLLATMYRGQSQAFIQNTFKDIYDLVQGTQEATLFEEPDNTPRTLVEAINEAINKRGNELLLNGKFEYDGQRRSDVLAGGSAASQQGRQGSDGSSQARGRTEDGTGANDGIDGTANETDNGRSGRNGGENKAGDEKEKSTKGQLTKAEAAEIIADMEEHAEVAPEMELTIENWDAEFGEDGIVQTPIGEVKMGENQFAKLMRQGRNGKLGMVKPTLENPDLIIEVESEAKEGDTTERGSSYVYVKAFIKPDGTRYYYFTSVTVSKDGREVVVSNQEKSRNRILRLMVEGSVIWRTPKDATTSSAEKQGLDYAHPNEAEDATKGSVITPQSTPSENKDSEKSHNGNESGGKVASADENPSAVPVRQEGENLFDYAERVAKEKEIDDARKKVEQNPTDAQKEAGNYRKGHVSLDGYDITIESPKGSVRSGKDASGQEWSVTMNNDYGYIRGTEGVDGDHIDVFLSDDPTQGDVYVIDQVNPSTGEFDEHKVMYGFKSALAAKRAYLSNYSPGWKGLGVVTKVSKEEFKKWVESSHRKTKPFAEYKSVNKDEDTDTLYREAVDETEEANERFNGELERYQNGEMGKNDMFHLGMPQGTMSLFLPNMPIVMRPRIINKASNTKHNVDTAALKNLPQMISEPIFVFRRNDNALGVLTEIKDRDGKNVCVAIELGKRIQDGGNYLEVNDIRSVHGRDAANLILPIIHNNTLAFVDKEKGLAWLSSASYNYQQEIAKQDLDSAANIVRNFENPSVPGENLRDGSGALTDDEVSVANDPTAMVRRVQELAGKLHLGNVDIVTDASTLQGKRAEVKGFYSRSTGRITIVIPNHASVQDVEQTLLHEAVAHYGLRKLFGDHFDTFLDNVFLNADADVRRRIVDLAKEHGWDFHTATEEYLASLAENTNFENMNASWWQKIKELFLKMLHKIGFEGFTGVTLSDNELRYILWRSYENLREPGRYRSIFGEAEDVAMQNELKVGNYAPGIVGTERDVAEQDDLYRDGDPEAHERSLARDRYEQRVRSGMYQSQEALQDSMLGLKEAMEAILKGEGKKKVYIEDIDGFENAYLGENRLSSVNQAEAEAFSRLLFKPLLKEVAKLARTRAEREALSDYMMAKHGLERNRVMREREKEKLIASSELAKAKPQQPSVDDDDYDLKMDAYDKAMEDWEKQVEEELGGKFEAIDKRDFAGLTALTGMEDVADAEAEARAMVDDYESNHDTEALWQRTKAVSDAILSKQYESGMMSKQTYDNIRSMYEYYIPLRGFDEKTSEEAYAYLNSKNSAFTAPIKAAKGRKSKADDPFAYLQSMAESSIMQGNRNTLVKQKFLNFVLNHPSDLASVSELWLQYDDVADEWKPVFPDNINADDTPAEVERKMQEFEEKMKNLAENEPDRYKHGKDTVDIPYRVVGTRDLRQHQVVVKRGGRDYVITINGNPRAAQALNGLTNPDNDMSGAIGAILKAGERINRELSALYTTRNPDFVASNFIRDMLYSNSMSWVKESPEYALRYHRNFARVNPVRMNILLAKYRKGTLDMNNKTERMFHQFMMNGGETGYANIRDIEKHKNDIRREIRKASGKIPVRKAWDLLWERFDEVNRGVENCARFAAFMTSREMGRTIDRAIWDAKEISVNFNKKGSGSKFMGATGQTKSGNTAAFVSGLGRSGFVFWNAAIQGTTNFGRQLKRHPAKAFTGVAAMFLLGAITAYLGHGDDDDDDKNSYWNLPEYVRRSNILFRSGDQWISIPLPVEYRAVYGLGELMASTLYGKEHLTDGELANAIAGQVSQVFPIDFLEGGGGFKTFIPSAIKPFAEAYSNKSWTGIPIYKDTPYNKNMPEWTKAYKSANKYLVDLSETLNEVSGGDKYTKGSIDINPAQVEYMLTGYFGGVANAIDRMTKMTETVFGEREYDPKDFLVLNRILKNGDERTEYRALNKEYYRLEKEHDIIKSRLRNYERDTSNGIFDYAEKISSIRTSPEYKRFEIFEKHRPGIAAANKALKEANEHGDTERAKEIETDLIKKKKEMIEEMKKKARTTNMEETEEEMEEAMVNNMEETEAARK